MSCDPSAILSTSEFRGLPEGQLDTIQVALLAGLIAPVDSANDIMARTTSDGFSDEQKTTMQVVLLCRLLEAIT